MVIFKWKKPSCVCSVHKGGSKGGSDSSVERQSLHREEARVDGRVNKNTGASDNKTLMCCSAGHWWPLYCLWKRGGYRVPSQTWTERTLWWHTVVGSESQPSSFSFSVIKHRLSKVKEKKSCRYGNAIVYLKKYVSIILFCILPQVENAHKNW